MVDKVLEKHVDAFETLVKNYFANIQSVCQSFDVDDDEDDDQNAVCRLIIRCLAKRQNERDDDKYKIVVGRDRFWVLYIDGKGNNSEAIRLMNDLNDRLKESTESSNEIKKVIGLKNGNDEKQIT